MEKLSPITIGKTKTGELVPLRHPDCTSLVVREGSPIPHDYMWHVEKYLAKLAAEEVATPDVESVDVLDTQEVNGDVGITDLTEKRVDKPTENKRVAKAKGNK
ncbi:MAG: hypothetical protein BGO01_03680 [Armatimonadetes bacterium 55-13]|nr:hypothetical protein [Armatimonadota bacterium]OJU63048.1 MAG: hypothetical protein BGO01_03680 [Armatimonadetes bacterium 55-13]